MSDDEPPLECNLKRPNTFDAYTICFSKEFSKEVVLYPRGLENPQQPGSGSSLCQPNKR